MKKLLILTCAVLVACIAVCTVAQVVLDNILTRAHEMNTAVFVALESGDEIHSREALVELATYWDEQQGILEVLCDHEDLHDVQSHIITARICLDYTDDEDFFTSVSLIGEGIEHLRDQEALHWANLL